MDRSQTSALDALEDARAELKRYRNGLGYIVFALVSSIVSVVAGSISPFAGLSWALCLLGSLGVVASVIVGAVWIVTTHDKHKHPEEAVRIAERKYRDAMNPIV